MFNPERYSKSNFLQSKLNSGFLKEYEDIANWKSSKCESVLDLGSGDGSFVSNKLVQFLPDSCKKIIGSDKFSNMVQFANEHYKTDRIRFEKLDVEDIVPEEYHNSFNHVFSFFALMFVRDQKKGFTNIYKLLTSEGTCFITMIGKANLFKTYNILRNIPKWEKWLVNTEDIKSVYLDCADSEKTIVNMLSEIGFCDIRVELKDIVYTFDNKNQLKDFLAGIEITAVPSDEYDDFFKDFLDVANSTDFVTKDLQMKFEVIIIYAKKQEDITSQDNNK